MQLHRPFRFGVVTHNTSPSLDALVARARLAERLGYSTFLIPDHLGDQFDTPLALALVAQATSTLRIGSLVFANDFRHPALLAKTAATLDVLSGGRFELGLGAGWMQSEYERIGLAFDPPGIRIERMVEALQIITGLFSDEPMTFSGVYYQVAGMRGSPSPLQRPHPPILLGGSGKRILSVAAREADIVNIIPRGMVEPGSAQRIDLSDAGATSLAQKVAWIREAAGERFQSLELNLFILDMALNDRQGDGADRLAHRFALSREQVLKSPHLLVGTVNHIVDRLQETRAKYGISYLVIFDEYIEQFAPIVAQLTNQ
ncbi:MAG TPA: TIGR03621 family F420-dependent LLM class oxidoreductase [Ktedonobacteraceae bacterium]